MAERSVLFVNLRRIPREGFESLLAARALGYRVVLIGRDLPDFARPLVHDARIMDTYDQEAALEAARDLAREHLVAGVANFTEIDVRLVAAIAADLGLPGLSPQAAVQARDKVEMKESLRHVDDLLPRFAAVRSLADLRSALEVIGLPAVVKPAGASGSKGIFELRKPADLEPAMRRLAEFARPEVDPVFRQFGGQFIVEEFVEGDEISVEGFVTGGDVSVVAVTDKITTVPFHLEVQHQLPSRLPATELAAVNGITRQVVAGLELDYCAFHLELKRSGGGFRFIEIAARPAGDYIASHLLPAATGVDFFQNVVRTAVGEPLQLQSDRSLHAGVRFVLADRPGRFDGLAGIEPLLIEPGYDHVFMEVAAGSAVALPPDHFGQQRVAAVCARHIDRSGLDDLLRRVGAEVIARTTATVSSDV